MLEWNIAAGWFGMVVGTVLGMWYGMYAESREWAGGYGSFRRQTLRLAHIAAFALGIINVLYGLCGTGSLWPYEWLGIAGSVAMIAGGLLMPVVCLLAAWRNSFKYLFPIPASCVLVGVGVQAWSWLVVAWGGM